METKFTTYLLTNWNRSLLYVGFTNNLSVRLIEHWIGNLYSHTTKFNIYYLVWYESTKYVLNAIDAEKKIKKYTRAQKNILINSFNPTWDFLNEEIVGNWPPTQEQIDAAKSRWRENRDLL